MDVGIKHISRGISECPKKAFGQPQRMRLTSNVGEMVAARMPLDCQEVAFG